MGIFLIRKGTKIIARTIENDLKRFGKKFPWEKTSKKLCET